MRDLESLTFDEVQRIVEGPQFEPTRPDVPKQRVSLPHDVLPGLVTIENPNEAKTQE